MEAFYLKFCSECGSICTIDHKQRCYVCVKCGKTEQLNEAISISRTIDDTEKVVVIGQKDRKLSTLPKTKITCPKCENKQAYWWMVQTRGIDESSTQFYRCTECGHTWREYS